MGKGGKIAKKSYYYYHFMHCTVNILGRQSTCAFKGIVSRDYGGLQMILMDGACVPDVPLEVYFFSHIVF